MLMNAFFYNTKRCALLLLGACLLASYPAMAQVAHFRFTGTVRESQDPTRPFQSPVSPWEGLDANVGDVVSGSFAYQLSGGINRSMDPNVSQYVEASTRLTVQLNGHTLTHARFLLQVADGADPHQGADSLRIQGSESPVIMDGVALPETGFEFLSIGLTLIDTSQSVFATNALPTALSTNAFDLKFGFIQRYDVVTYEEVGIEFAIDTLERVFELDTGDYLSWAGDAGGYLEVSESVEGPWKPFAGDSGLIGDNYVALLPVVSGKTFYQLRRTPFGERLFDDFDAYPVGTAPDIGTALGVWEFPEAYVTNTTPLGESNSGVFSVVSTADFDGGAEGNSLKVAAGRSEVTHLVGMLPDVIHESAVSRAVVRFDFLVPSGAHGGFAVYLAGDHGGGGFDSISDRGPQLLLVESLSSVYAIGRLGETVASLSTYARDTWQTLEFVVDLRNDRYEVRMGIRGEPLTTVGTDLAFRSGPLHFLDRFSLAAFPTWNDWLGYVDNVVVDLRP